MNKNLTDFQSVPKLTNKTDETNIVSNNDFLRTLFGSDLKENRPLTVSFSGDPYKVPRSSWYGRPWLDNGLELPHDANNYFSLAMFHPNDTGEYRRKKTQFVALYVIMLDDIGSKVPMERITLPPTWQIETSPGNHQVGYLLHEPLSDGLLADRVINAIIQAGLCDPGSDGPQARLARLPSAVNGKHSPPFQCRLVRWEPNTRYTIKEIIENLQLDMTLVERTKCRGSGLSQPRPDGGDPVWIPRPEENTVLAAIRKLALYKAPLGDDKIDLTCPWVDEHTGGIDNGTAYFEPSDNWPIGGFKCMHGHCKHRHIRDLLSFLGIEPSVARMKPTIRIVPGEIHRIADAAERELANAQRYYQRGGLITTVTTDPGTQDTRIQEISQPALVRALAGVATWERYDLKSQDWLRTDPPARHSSVLFDSTSYHHLPVLNGLARQPYLRPDGSLMMIAGYDPATGMFGVFDARNFSIPDNPTQTDALDSLAILRELVSEFSFTNESDFSASLTAMLTASIRPSIPLAPMFHARAHMVGSGKSFLCELITAFATPQRGTPTAFPSDDEECRKLMLAELLRSPAVVEFDNLTGDLVAHKSLCTALTSEHMSGRILGVSKTATVGTRTLFLSSGNNVGPVQDMTRRCITINLSPQCEIPAARGFKRPNLIQEVLRERGRYVSAALTIIRSWIVAGRPKVACRSLASYEEWSDLCRQPLMWLGCADPTASVFEAMAEDPDRETLSRLIDGWFDRFGKIDVMVRDIVKPPPHGCGNDFTELLEVLHDIAGDHGGINRRKLGWWIRRHSGRIIDGKRIIRAAGNSSAERWRIEIVE